MNLKKHSYYIGLIVTILVLFIITYLLQFHKIFFMLYQINYNSINTSILTIYGVLFAFIFAIMAILFSLKEDSFFVKLMQENHQKKQDVVNYFLVSLISVSFVMIISFFLTITYIGDSIKINSELISFLSNISLMNNCLIYSLIYFLEFSVVSIVLLLIMFIIIIKK